MTHYIVTMTWGSVKLQWDIDSAAPQFAFSQALWSEKYIEMWRAHGNPERVTIEEAVAVGMEVESE